MRNLEDFEQSCEYHIQPERIFKTFTATIFETDQIFVDVICYPLHLDGEVLDVEIKLPIYLQKPISVRDDVAEALRQEYGLTLGKLKFTMSPKEFTI